MSLNKLREWAENQEPAESSWEEGINVAKRHVCKLLQSVSPVVQTHSFTVEEMVPAGWRLYSMDFSSVGSEICPAERQPYSYRPVRACTPTARQRTSPARRGKTGNVELKRNAEQALKWSKLNHDDDDCPSLYVMGHGRTFAEALADACQKARDEGTLP